MAVDSTSSTTGFSSSLLASVNGTTKTTTDTTSTVDADQNKFLTLLVTQLQNQDPLNPTDNAELTSQLAQLSTVSGINTLNATVSSLQSSFQSSQALTATNMIGRGVLVDGTALKLTSSQAVYGIDLATAADNVTITIKDSTGATVKTIDMGAQPAGTQPLIWDGKVENLKGTGVAGVVADGAYTFSVNATRSGTALTDAAALTYGTVASVSTGSAGVTLNVPAIGKLNMDAVKQVL